MIMLKLLASKKFRQIFQLFANFYFLLINFGFKLINRFRSKAGIDWAIDDDYLVISAAEAAEKIRTNQISSTQLVSAYIDRITRVNPVINAVVENNFIKATEAAEYVDDYLKNLDKSSQEFRDLAKTKPLLGVPFTCKCNLKVEGFVSIIGNPKFVNNPPSDSDAEVVRRFYNCRLRNAGAILLATTNTPMMGESWGDSENAVFGRTNNPYDVRLTPGGSSGGEAALIASAGSVIGLGNDIGGSLRIPAAFCGIFSLRATPNLIPLDGLVGAFVDDEKSDGDNDSIWVIGPMCRYAGDLPVVFKVLVGEERTTALKIDDEVDLQNIRVFYMEGLDLAICERYSAEARVTLERARKCFEIQFGTIAHKVDFPLTRHLFEMWAACRYRMPDRPVPSLTAVLMEAWKYLLGQSESTHLQIALSFLATIVAPKDAEERSKVLRQRDLLRHQMQNLLGDDSILLFPTFPTPTPFHGVPKFSEYNFAYTLLFSVLGLPSLACPAGTTNGLPMGVQIVGSPNSERVLFAAAKAVEKGLGGWKPGLKK